MNPSTFRRRAGISCVAIAGASLVLAPLHALARMRTDSGLSDFENPLAHWWAAPAMDAVGGLLDWGSPDTVYETYGKFNFVALLAVLACALAVRGQRPRPLRFSERWGWRLSFTSYWLLALSMFTFYWISSLDLLFLVATIPGLLLNAVGQTMLGIGLVRSGFRPRLTGWILALSFPLSQALVVFSTQALGMWPMMLAWAAAGWTLWRSELVGEPVTERPRTPAGQPR